MGRGAKNSYQGCQGRLGVIALLSLTEQKLRQQDSFIKISLEEGEYQGVKRVIQTGRQPWHKNKWI